MQNKSSGTIMGPTRAEGTGQGGRINEPETPLVVLMEGKNRYLSIMMISITAILMWLYQSADELGETIRKVLGLLEDQLGHVVPADRIVSLFFWIASLSFASAFIVMTLRTNTHPHKKGWASQRACACVMLLLWDIGSIFPVIELICAKDREDDDLLSSYFTLDPGKWIIALFLMAGLLSVNITFICLPWHWTQASESRSLGGLPVGAVIDIPKSKGAATSSHGMVQKRESHPKDTASEKQKQEIVSKSPRENLLEKWDAGISEREMEDDSESVSDTATFTVLEDDDDMEVGCREQMFLGLSSRLNKIWKDVKEEEGFKYSVWFLSGVLIAVFLLFHNMVFTTIKLQRVASEIQRATQVYLDGVHESEGQKDHAYGIPDPLQRAASLIANAELVLSGLLANESIIGHRDHAQELVQHLSAFGNDESYKRAEWLDSFVHIIDDHTGVNFGSAPSYFMDYTKVLQGTLVVGFLIGTAIGLHAVYTVTASYKRMSMELSPRFPCCSEGGRGGVMSTYPIGRSVFFVGIMTSGAVIQQTIFGFLISLVLGVVVNIEGYGAFMRYIGYWLLVILLTVLVNEVIISYVGNKSLSDGLRVKHPRGFLLYMCTFSMLHFVLGIYYALYRMVWLMLTSLLIMSRLDITVFTHGKQFDNGHNTFMSVLLLTQATQQNLLYRRPRREDENVG